MLEYYEHYPFTLKPLPYAYDGLEPIIDEETLVLHHTRHLQTYIDNLNKALAPYPSYHEWSLENLIVNVDRLPSAIQIAVKNNAGGVYAHNLYFAGMSPPNGDQCPRGNLRAAIDQQYGSVEQMKKELRQAGLNRFGSGWSWLVSDKNGRLQILSTANQDTPLPLRLTPILLIDVWEHAYYLKYHNRRDLYLESFDFLISWEKAEREYQKVIFS